MGFGSVDVLPSPKIQFHKSTVPSGSLLRSVNVTTSSGTCELGVYEKSAVGDRLPGSPGSAVVPSLLIWIEVPPGQEKDVLEYVHISNTR